MILVLCGTEDGIYRLLDGPTCVGTIHVYTDIKGRVRARIGPPLGVVRTRCRQVTDAELKEVIRLLPLKERNKLPQELREL